MIITVAELIRHLNVIEDKTQPVIYQYYLAEHFTATPGQFQNTVDAIDCEDLWDDAHATISEYISGLATNEEEE